MEKQTRMSKYKDLRAEMMEEVPIHHSEMTTIEEDDDFLAFIPKKQEKKLEDTLMEPLTYETLDKNDEGVRSAITRAKANVGKEEYNTRLDILSKIKGEDFVESKVEEKKTPTKKMSLLEKLASISPEEDVEELKKFQSEEKKKETVKKEVIKEETVKEETVEEKITSPFIGIKEKKVEEVKEEPVKQTKIKDLLFESDDEEVEDEKESKVVTVLNYAIIALMLVFVGLICFIIKDILF